MNKKITILIAIIIFVIGLTSINVKATEYNDLSRLQYSEIYGQYHENYRNYNCYQFAIERFEEVSTYHFDSSFTKEDRYHPGFYSTGASAFNKSTVNTATLALIVQSDLLALGMTDVLISNSIPILNINEKLICMRVDNGDYHFMKYIKEEDIWVHKPMDTFPLKYNGDIAAGDSWSNEGIMVSKNAPDYYHYTYIEETAKYEGEIKFIKYTTPDKLNLNCRMNQLRQEAMFDAKLDIIYEMNVECEGAYVVNIGNNDGFVIYIYDQYMMKVDSLEYNEDESVFNVTSGKYYLLIYYHYSNEGECTANFTINVTLPYIESLIYGNNTVESLNLNIYDFHKTVDNNIECVFKYMNNNNTGFYKITINNMYAASIRNIEIRTENGPIPQYDYENNNLDPVYTKTIMVYLKDNTEYLLYLNTIESFNDGISVNIEYIEYNALDIDLFNANENVDTVYNLFENISNSSEFVQKIYLNQVGKFKFDISYSSINDSDICIWLVEESELSNKTFNFESNNLINQNNEQNIILEEGVYYIVGIVQNQEDINLSFLLKRIITDSGSDVLIPDPDPLYNPSKTCGSHINIYEKDLPRSEKSYGGNEILKGFTRVIYLDQSKVGACYNSDYYWYSSNNSIATISSFGTIHAKLVGTVRIMAVNKIDPSEVYIKDFNIVNNSNSNVVSIQLSGEFDLSDGEYTLVLTVTNCPYPMIQYYNWTMQKDDDVEADMNGWGIVKANTNANTPRTIILTGDYIYNMNYKIIYTIYLIKDN